MKKVTFIILYLVLNVISLQAQNWNQSFITAAKDAPNILFICPDQQKWNTIGALGNEYVKTPNIDRLVEEGVSFTKAHCQSTVCTPSRSSFMTGMYPSTVHGCKNGAAEWSEAAPLISKILKDNGYYCGLSGKLHLSTAMGNLPEKRPKDDGFRVFHWSPNPRESGSENEYLEWLRQQGYDYTELMKKYGYIPAELHQTKWCIDMAIDFMKEKRNRPWFFMINIYDPHRPLDPPQEFVDRYDIDNLPNPIVTESDYTANPEIVEKIMFQSKPKKYSDKENKIRLAKYWAQIDLIDIHIGRLLKTLEETNQLDKTLIIYTSDHGDMTGDHGLTAKGCRFYDGLVRVPLIFRYPKKFQKSLQSDALVELTDIVPTLLDVTGIEGHERIQGKSLFPILTGEKQADYHRDYVRSEFYDALMSKNKAFATMYRTEKYKLNVYHGIDEGELYDMENDTNEFNNLWNNPDYQSIKTKLLKASFDASIMHIDTGPERIAGH